MNWNKITKFIFDHLPTMCWSCQKIMFEKNAEYEYNRFGNLVALCGDCHDKLYNPFSSKHPHSKRK